MLSGVFCYLQVWLEYVTLVTRHHAPVACLSPQWSVAPFLVSLVSSFASLATGSSTQVTRDDVLYSCHYFVVVVVVVVRCSCCFWLLLFFSKGVTAHSD